MDKPLVIWCIQDGRTGHENQIRGLVQAISRLCEVQSRELSAPSKLHGWLGRLPENVNELPKPDLIIGAGHRTHPPLLTARRRFGGRSIVIMRPSLPKSMFDLCLIPDTHIRSNGANVILTRGSIGLMAPSNEHDPKRGLISIGGPSRHHSWDDAAVIKQVETIVDRQASIRWEATSSPRTPSATTDALQALRNAALTFTSFENTDRDWLPERMRVAGQIWTTEDSISMLYESVTSGASVGAISVPCKRESRNTRAVASMAEKRWITRFVDWERTGVLNRPSEVIDEAARCAALICKRYGLISHSDSSNCVDAKTTELRQSA